METVGMFEAKTHFSALAERVKMGEEIEISQRGKPIMKLVPIRQANGASTEDILAGFDALRAGILARNGGVPFTWEELKSYRDEGRK